MLDWLHIRTRTQAWTPSCPAHAFLHGTRRNRSHCEALQVPYWPKINRSMKPLLSIFNYTHITQRAPADRPLHIRSMLPNISKNRSKTCANRKARIACIDFDCGMSPDHLAGHLTSAPTANLERFSTLLGLIWEASCMDVRSLLAATNLLHPACSSQPSASSLQPVTPNLQRSACCM